MIYYHVMIHWDEITEADYIDDVKIDLFLNGSAHLVKILLQYIGRIFGRKNNCYWYTTINNISIFHFYTKKAYYNIGLILILNLLLIWWRGCTGSLLTNIFHFCPIFLHKLSSIFHNLPFPFLDSNPELSNIHCCT